MVQGNKKGLPDIILLTYNCITISYGRHVFNCDKNNKKDVIPQAKSRKIFFEQLKACIFEDFNLNNSQLITQISQKY